MQQMKKGKDRNGKGSVQGRREPWPHGDKRTSGDDGTRVNEIDEVNGSHSTKKTD